MSKVSYINKSLLSISKFSLKKNLCSLHTTQLISESNNQLCSLRSKLGLLSNASTVWNPEICRSKHMYIVENVFKSSGARQISFGQHLMCSTQKNSTVLEEPSGEETNSSNIEKELNEKIKLLQKEVEEYKDKYQRSLADRENLRQRLEKQISDSKLFGIQSFCKDLLEVSDVFRKALECVPEDKLKVADPQIISLYDGVVMTENNLLSVFRRHGLKRIIPVEGDKFDPSLQEAMFEVAASEGKLPGTVAHVVRTGWTLHDRCVRSAQVGVVKN